MMDGKHDLRPCPFCGGEAVLKTYRDNLRGDAFAAMCQKTDCPGRTYRKRATSKAAAEAWNRRAAPENRVLTLEEVKAHCEGGVEAEPLWLEFKRDNTRDRWAVAVTEDKGEYMPCIARYIRIWPETYGIRWRCWLRKPTAAEMAGAPWEG